MTHANVQSKTFGITICLSILVMLMVCGNAMGQETMRVAAGLSQPVFATYAPGDANRLYIVEQYTRQIKVLNLNTGTLGASPFFNGPSVATGSEQGLLGMAFDPNYQSNGYFYVNYTDTGGDTVIARYQANTPDDADESSATVLMKIDQPQSNHNGGWLGFGPDHMMYIGMGDGGGGDDNDGGHASIGNGQSLNTLLGKMLRIDPSGDDFPADTNRNYRIPSDNPFVDGDTNTRDEIWAYGLRNPWRASFDRQTGDLYIGDVGQNAREEVDVQPAESTGGENYGWRLREGTIATPTGGVGGPRPTDAIDPIYNYIRGTGDYQGRSVTGGYVYRGHIEALQGRYFFGDYINSRIWSLIWDGSDPATFDGTNYTDLFDHTSDFVPDVGSIGSIASFAEDAAGNLYIIDRGGQVFKLVADATLPGDFNGDMAVDATDLAMLLGNWGSSALPNEPNYWVTNWDGFVDANELADLLANWGAGVGYPQPQDASASTAIPEPATLLLLSLGGMVAGRARSKKNS